MLMTICFVLIPISCGHEWPSCDKGGKNCEQVVNFHPFYGGWMPTYADKSMNNFLGGNLHGLLHQDLGKLTRCPGIQSLHGDQKIKIYADILICDCKDRKAG